MPSAAGATSSAWKIFRKSVNANHTPTLMSGAMGVKGRDSCLHDVGLHACYLVHDHARRLGLRNCFHQLSGCPIVVLLSRAACRIEARAKPVPAAQLSHHAACQQHPTHEHGREIHSAPDAFRARYVAHRHRRCSGSQLVIGEPLAESEETACEAPGAWCVPHQASVTPLERREAECQVEVRVAQGYF